MVADAGGHKHPQLLLVAWQLKTVSVASASVNFARCAWVRLLPRMLLLPCFFFPRGRLQVRVQCFDRAGPPGTLMAKPREARLPTGEEVDEFFQKLEAEATFPAAALEQLAPPELVSLWKDIAATQSVAWPWVMLCELALASFLTPNARLHPLASFTVFSLTWTFFVHPGSCHTSNLLRLYQNVFHGIEKKVNRYRAEECARLRQQVQAGADGQALLKQRLAKLQPLALRLGTGSLEGIGLRMSQFPDWTATSGFLVEGLQFVQWLQAEFGLNRAIATQLWERMSWQRDVVNQGRSFDMTYPFLGVCGALHLEDVWPMFAQPDPLGLRGRLCFFYSRPALKRAREIEEANARLQNYRGSNNLEHTLVERFWRIYQAHAHEHRPAAAFSWHLEYPFLNYAFGDGDDAANIFARAFDEHVQLQAAIGDWFRCFFSFFAFALLALHHQCGISTVMRHNILGPFFLPCDGFTGPRGWT